jgi:hypothetical protein
LFQSPVVAPGAPFAPGLPDQSVLSPDGDARRAAYQRTGKGRGHHGEDLSKSTLALSPSVPVTPDGVGDGMSSDAGNHFLRSFEHVGTVGTENGPPVPVSIPKSDMPQTARSEAPQPKCAASPTRSTSRVGVPEGEKAVNIYDSGMYWRLLD